ncbi:hypothetical protein BOTBODRAFT_545153 [Botryobasidium botryosum FD-172 SS1]|uniref:Uncharacterized protein n=1 Tax=Botryobasidium botryosum (strain FD-172 SS1) TaxID=930990 RepID=A0A067N1E4_BOTB1|nr:hypothetical protein BOTBODRAFT_545153 [Botryobasidium botryosum FD-172 SS1]
MPGMKQLEPAKHLVTSFLAVTAGSSACLLLWDFSCGVSCQMRLCTNVAYGGGGRIHLSGTGTDE